MVNTRLFIHLLNMLVYEIIVLWAPIVVQTDLIGARIQSRVPQTLADDPIWRVDPLGYPLWFGKRWWHGEPSAWPYLWIKQGSGDGVLGWVGGGWIGSNVEWGSNACGFLFSRWRRRCGPKFLRCRAVSFLPTELKWVGLGPFGRDKMTERSHRVGPVLKLHLCSA
jgi:hypothetical protein